MKYLFTAHYSDGSFYEQTHEDISLIDPTKSAFFDIRHDDLVTFEIESEGIEGPPLLLTVDLRDGHFELNSLALNIGPDQVPPDAKLRLIYFRRVQRDFNVATGAETAVRVAFHIGWQYNDANGKNVQRTIEIA
jgi:hypothetical protein